jgi:fluoride exporter
MSNYLWVFLGGGLGSILRFFVNNVFVERYPNFPIATLVSNVAASFLLGLFMYFFAIKSHSLDSWRLFLAVGLCGGFSTFSTFSYDTFRFFENGETLFGIGNIILSLFTCILAVFLGLWLAKSFA